MNFTPTRMIPIKAMKLHVPIDPQKIIEQVLEAAEQGVNMAHLHARDPDTGKPVYKKEICGKIISGLKK